MSKKITSIVLSICMMLSCVMVGSFVTNAVTIDAEEVSANDYGLVDDVQQGQILQCWNWSYTGIKNNMKKIAEQGFSAIQTSPVQTIKESTQNRAMSTNWWVYYQPSNFNIDTSSQNALGTKSEFKAMCDEAHKYGVKVIVDAILNHMANKSGNDLSDTIPSDIRNDSSCWHSITVNTSNWNDRYDITHNCMSGLPDLNTGSTKIQNYATNFLKECIEAGADGFRFDGAKHIEVPADSSNVRSDFWPNVLNAATSYAQSTRGITPYYYGEILDSTGGVAITGYTQYMSVTDNGISNSIRNCVNSGNASGAANSYIGMGSAANKTVQWNESHDTYADGSSSGVSDSAVNKTWAIVGGRADICGMYFARPSSSSNLIGTAGVTAWANPEVKAVNQFKNYFVGKSEYLSSSGSIAYNERGTEGVVLVNCSGGSTSVNVSAKKMASGTYTDQITGNTFTVSGGQIKGQIGSTGIAVVYNAKPAGPSASVTPGSSKYKTDTLTLTLKYSGSATSGQYSIDGGAYKSFTNGQNITIGSGVAYNAVTTVSVKASDGTVTSDVETYTYTKIDPSSVDTIYYDNSSTKWSNVNVYFWSDQNLQMMVWPGEGMTNTSGNIYEAEIPEGATYVIFNNGIGTQTDDLTIPGSDMMYQNGSWISYSPVQPTTAKPTVAPTTAQPTTQPTTAKPTVAPTTAKPTTQPTTTQPTTQATNKILLGDVDNNKIINVNDATTIQKYIAEQTTLTGNALIAADVDKDGVITIKDTTCIQMYIAQVQLKGTTNYCGTYVDEATQPTVPPTTQPVDSGYIYSKGYTHAYFWSDSENDIGGVWPGVAMQNVVNNVYKVEVPDGATYVVFSNSGNGQSSDLTIQGTGMIFDGGTWKSYSEDQDATTPTLSGYNYVSYDNSSSNWSTVYAYFWNDSQTDIGGVWPGTQMTRNGNTYSIAIPDGATKVIFTNGSGAQTGDLDIKVNGTYSNGSWK